MVGDRPFLAGDSALDDLEVGAAISNVVLLPADINRMGKLSEYENYAIMMQHCILVSLNISNFLSNFNSGFHT